MGVQPKSAGDLLSDELARCTCYDCGVKVVTIGEFYMLNDNIWTDQLGLGEDKLRIGCLEARIGRQVCFADIITCPLSLDEADVRSACRSVWARKRQPWPLAPQVGEGASMMQLLTVKEAVEDHLGCSVSISNKLRRGTSQAPSQPNAVIQLQPLALPAQIGAQYLSRSKRSLPA